MYYVLYEVDDWRIHRRLVTPILNETSIRPHLMKFNDIIYKTMISLPCDNDETIDLMKYFAICKIDMFVQAALGESLESNVRQKYLNVFAK